mgnify:CR=1 FL=1
MNQDDWNSCFSYFFIILPIELAVAFGAIFYAIVHWKDWFH